MHACVVVFFYNIKGVLPYRLLNGHDLFFYNKFIISCKFHVQNHY